MNENELKNTCENDQDVTQLEVGQQLSHEWVKQTVDSMKTGATEAWTMAETTPKSKTQLG